MNRKPIEPDFVLAFICIISSLILGIKNPSIQNSVVNILSAAVGGYFGHLAPTSHRREVK